MQADFNNEQPNQLSNSRQPLILVVEDDEDNLLVIAHTLIFFQYTFITATNAQQALELVEKCPVDLMLVDIVLSGTNGLDLVHDLKYGRLTKNIPVIALTALARKEDKELILSAGCDDYLCKPFLLDELNSKIRYHLGSHFFYSKTLKIA